MKVLEILSALRATIQAAFREAEIRMALVAMLP